jgi:hypothetical protein
MISNDGGNATQDFQAGDPPYGRVGVGKVVADILQACRSEQGIGYCMAENICIGVSRECQPLRMVEVHSSQYEGSPRLSLLEPVNIITDTTACDPRHAADYRCSKGIPPL